MFVHIGLYKHTSSGTKPTQDPINRIIQSKHLMRPIPALLLLYNGVDVLEFKYEEREPPTPTPKSLLQSDFCFYLFIFPHFSPLTSISLAFTSIGYFWLWYYIKNRIYPANAKVRKAKRI